MTKPMTLWAVMFRYGANDEAGWMLRPVGVNAGNHTYRTRAAAYDARSRLAANECVERSNLRVTKFTEAVND
jgi:hypothetical protein